MISQNFFQFIFRGVQITVRPVLMFCRDGLLADMRKSQNHVRIWFLAMGHSGVTYILIGIQRRQIANLAISKVFWLFTVWKILKFPAISYLESIPGISKVQKSYFNTIRGCELGLFVNFSIFKLVKFTQIKNSEPMKLQKWHFLKLYILKN